MLTRIGIGGVGKTYGAIADKVESVIVLLSEISMTLYLSRSESVTTYISRSINTTHHISTRLNIGLEG